MCPYICTKIYLAYNSSQKPGLQYNIEDVPQSYTENGPSGYKSLTDGAVCNVYLGRDLENASHDNFCQVLIGCSRNVLVNKI